MKSLKLLIFLCSIICVQIQAQEIANNLSGKILEKKSSRWIGYKVEKVTIDDKSWNLNYDFYYHDGVRIKHIKSISSTSKMVAKWRSKKAYSLSIENDTFPLSTNADSSYVFNIMNTMDNTAQSMIEFCANINGGEGFFIFLLCAPFASLPYVLGVAALPVDLALTALDKGFSLENRALRSFDILNDGSRVTVKMRTKKFNALLEYLSKNKGN